MISPPSFLGRWPRLGWHRAFGANQNAGQRPAPSQHGANAPCRPSKRPRAPTARIIAWQGEMRAQWKSGSSTFVMGKAKAVGPQKSGTRLGRWMPPPPHPGLLPRGEERGLWPACNSKAALTHPVAGLLVQRGACRPLPEDGRGEGERRMADQEITRACRQPLKNSSGNLTAHYKRRRTDFKGAARFYDFRLLPL